MLEIAPILWKTGAAVAASMLALWVLSVRIRDASIADVYWGTGFVLVAWVAALAGDGEGPRRTLVLALSTVWGLRLTVHLARRNLGKGEDPRYQAMRRRHGERFWLVSLGTVFGLQGILLWIVSLPLQAAAALPSGGLSGLDVAGAALWTVGFLFEAVGDRQLRRFRADPANRGKVMDRGLWALTRHPNYFGDAALWWGLGLVGAAAAGPWMLVGPALMTFLLLRVSGVTLLERDIAERRPGYRAYVARTSAFFPWFPRKERP